LQKHFVAGREHRQLKARKRRLVDFLDRLLLNTSNINSSPPHPHHRDQFMSKQAFAIAIRAFYFLATIEGNPDFMACLAKKALVATAVAVITGLVVLIRCRRLERRRRLVRIFF